MVGERYFAGATTNSIYWRERERERVIIFLRNKREKENGIRENSFEWRMRSKIRVNDENHRF